ncbi:MAG: DUF7322 domain-containing protein [Halobacteriota archaeon]|uniref:DUF7322 domain-containing protein n=1 Tax=Natronomonas sp. TaxID=2184060 RepID=UPI003975A176
MNSLEEDESDAWPDEPDEFDPENIGPEIPDTEPTLDESLKATEGVSEELFRAFWAAVLLLNVALAALSIGAMLIYFRSDYRTGGPVLLIGIVAGIATFRYYWGAKTGRYADDDPSNEGATPGQTDERTE